MLSSICCLALVDLGQREVAVTAVDRLELAAVDSHSALREELQLPAQHHEATADVADARAVVMPEVRNRLEVRRQTPRQPHQLDVALALVLQPPAALHAVQVPIDVDLQEHRRVVRRAARVRRPHPIEPQLAKIQFGHERVDHANRVVLANEVVQTLGQQRHLLPVLPFNESRHTSSAARYVRQLYGSLCCAPTGFSHALGRRRE